MSVNNVISYYICFLFLFKLLSYVNGNTTKGSLTFVIDSTRSMYNEIDAVKVNTNALFNAVLESNATNIDDFVLVTFEDPNVQLRTKTRDPDEFRKAVDGIQLMKNGNSDCPEYSMSGIILALEQSQPNSYFYVYTDASAKDYMKFEEVKSLSIKKSTMVTFLLTGECSSWNDDDYVVYDNLAKATNGEVFHIERDEVEKIIQYIIESVKGVKTIIGKKYLNSGSEKQFQFNADTKEWDVIVSVTSNGNPNFYVIGPDGRQVETENIAATGQNLIKKLMTVEPGTYTIYLESNDKTSISVTASTSVTFIHGFSATKPGSLKETATKPIAGTRSHIAISLNNLEKDVTLNTVELIDMDDNIILELPLKLMNKDEQFYVSETFLPGKHRCKLRVVGYTKDKQKIVRLGSTTIESQDISLEKDIINTKPATTIIGDVKITVEYDESLVVKCKVSAYPKPEVTWKDSSGNILPSTTVPVELPYYYMSTINLESLKNNVKATCKAVNDLGEAESSINIEIKSFLNILESPKDSTVPYGNTEVFQLKVDAYPSLKITWYKDLKRIDFHEAYGFSPNYSILTIKGMNFTHTGKYLARISNGYQEKNITFNVFIHAAKPKIDKSITVMRILQGSKLKILCSLTQGYPRPRIQWYYSQESGHVILLEAAGETFEITSVSTKNKGVYSCTAKNDIGEDEHEIDLLVQYPPSIKQSDETKEFKQGSKVVLPCTADGEPKPNVKWLKDDVDISRVHKYKIKLHNIKMLRFDASLDDIGVFTCIATNSLGEAKRKIQINVISSVFIDPPAETTLYLNVGSKQELTCNAHGVPKPDVKWEFSSFDRKIKRRILSPGAENSITIERIQFTDEGFYMCAANNTDGPISEYLTYTVYVTEPPVIVNILANNNLTAVKGDVLLRIPCKATGRPKPTIRWMKEEYDLAIGTEWYDIEADGSLIIKKIDQDNDGRYKCIAENTVGSTFEEFFVEVLSYPKVEEISTEIDIEEGKSTHIKCDLPYTKLDKLQWYKDGRLIQNGQLYFSNVSTSDSGVYTCRVSNFIDSHSSHKRIVVLSKPKFISDEEMNIEYNEGQLVLLSCGASSYPEPIVEWFHNNVIITETSMDIVRELSINDIGNYTCNVFNKLGSISRIFNIFTDACILNIETDFNEEQPLVINNKGHWKILDNMDGLILIPKTDILLLICPENNIIYRYNTFKEYEVARCFNKKTFEVSKNGKITHVDFTELKCLKKPQPQVKVTEMQCGQANERTEMITVGFKIGKMFLDVYDVCIDKDKKVPIYARHNLTKSFANKIPKTISHLDFTTSTHLPFDFNYMYQCVSERSASIEACCYTERQLISPRDVLPGLPQVATYNYLNIVPHWSTCGTENWNEVERRVRDLSRDLGKNLEVWTGSSSSLIPPSPSIIHMDDYLTDRYGSGQPIGPFIWKVIQNLESREALAVIQLNIRDLPQEKAAMLLPCRDICYKIDWMKHTKWYDVEKGFTFCCSIEDFKSAFGFKYQFKNVKNILTNHSVP